MNDKLISAEMFSRELKAAGFLGAYKFWMTLKETVRPPDEVSELARDMLKALGAITLGERGGVAASPQEDEALRYCGLSPMRILQPGEIFKR